MGRPRKYPPNDELAELIESLLWQHGRQDIGSLITLVQAHTGLAVPDYNIRQAIHHHRNQLSNDTGALIVSVVGTRWVYEMTADPERITQWLAMRERSVETQLKTMLAQAETSVRISPARSLERRRARVELKLIGRLVEDIADLREEVTA